ncbi:hypothetical protein GGTG_06390 [Gaeumannomyces tritici R3-111a-1]|uniref:Uncharacterized protein n=1 Tax=Gaeumannomyces tritici (strain R3-111a-1) TaxID=644352 RepID=J3NYN8_GAET3|nr:hypothetical protein GGTG_06390 [Gaeumannomyces tritici R3-111a-1]EJT76471.1 hypothetical protein GGTG_06390 [Gaeumannomyces tritici R3-111a-1]
MYRSSRNPKMASPPVRSVSAPLPAKGSSWGGGLLLRPVCSVSESGVALQPMIHVLCGFSHGSYFILFYHYYCDSFLAQTTRDRPPAVIPMTGARGRRKVEPVLHLRPTTVDRWYHVDGDGSWMISEASAETHLDEV